jgi:hypothetical protein
MQVDPRAVRFGAAVTIPILALVLLPGGAWLLGAQVALSAAALAFAAATIHAATGFSPGCETNLIVRRLLPAATR